MMPPGVPQPPAQAGMMAPGAHPASGTPAAGQAPISPDKLKLLELPTWEEVEALLQNPVHREFRLDIETDSTIRMDEDAEKDARMEFLNAVGSFLDKAVMAGGSSPEIVPVLGEILMFAVRAFKTARPIEQAFEDAIDALEKASKQPRPNPELQKAQIEAQTEITVAKTKAQLDAQIAQAKEQAQAQRDQIQQQLEAARAKQDAQLQASLEQHKAQLQSQTDAHIQEMKNQFEAQRVQFETSAKIHIAQLDADTKLRVEGMRLQHEGQQKEADRAHEARMGEQKLGHEKEMEGKKEKHEKELEGKKLEHEEKLAKEKPKEEKKDDGAEKIAAKIGEHLNRPRKVIRDKDGRITGLE